VDYSDLNIVSKGSASCSDRTGKFGVVQLRSNKGRVPFVFVRCVPYIMRLVCEM
jgi:hypothetical protein